MVWTIENLMSWNFLRVAWYVRLVLNILHIFVYRFLSNVFGIGLRMYRVNFLKKNTKKFDIVFGWELPISTMSGLTLVKQLLNRSIGTDTTGVFFFSQPSEQWQARHVVSVFLIHFWNIGFYREISRTRSYPVFRYIKLAQVLVYCYYHQAITRKHIWLQVKCVLNIECWPNHLKNSSEKYRCILIIK